MTHNKHWHLCKRHVNATVHRCVKCICCEFEFLSGGANKINMFRKVHKCPFCTYASYKTTHLNYHMKTHTGEKPYQRNVCGKHFGRKFTCTRHLMMHNKDSYLC